MVLGVRIGFAETDGDGGLPGRVILELEGLQLAIFNLDEVYLLLRSGAPEVMLEAGPAVQHLLAAFGDKVVFPQGSGVVAFLKRIEIVDQGVADPVVPEIDLEGQLELRPQAKSANLGIGLPKFG